MFISMNWISEFVDLRGLDRNKLISQFSLSTAEVENEIFYKGSNISDIVVAEIVEVNAHPESEKLHLLKVNCGSDELMDVVCGAPNVKVGMKTAYAKVGARIGNITIEPKKVAGYLSYGMCCSEAELDLSDDNSGIMEISDATVGTDLKELFEIDDIIFEVDNKSLTNRPDLWGHYGIAREFATLADRPLKPLDLYDVVKYSELPSVDMKIEDDMCQRYSCIKIENINTNVSPMNMRIRLHYCGLRAINLLADLTNYIMLEVGQPMHAFDSRKVEKIRIKRFEDSFEFTTLDKVERTIDNQTLMICNGDEPVAIAGIMGGLDSEILDDTKELTLESATFEASAIRKASVRLAHRTDASARYEKSLDPELCPIAIKRFLHLLSNIDSDINVVSSLTDEWRFHYPKVELEFDKSYVDKYTGIDISGDEIEHTLMSLGFGVERENNDFKVAVPSWRATKDVTIKADIIEEITRIYGYDNFDVFTVESPLYPIRMAEEKIDEEQIKDMLVKRFGLHEVHSYIWMYYDEYKKLGIVPEENVKLLNATNPNIETIRNSIIPTQLCQLSKNLEFAPEFGMFEIGRVVNGCREDGTCDERKNLAITLYSKETDYEKLYYKLKDMLENMTRIIKHDSLSFKVKEATHSYQHPKNLNEIICQDKVIGELGVAHPTVLGKIDKRAAIVYAELDVKAFSELVNKGIQYIEPSKFPTIEIDLSFVVDKFEPINGAIKAAKSELIKKVEVIDVYQSATEKSITVRIVFSNNERTLTREEVLSITDGIIDYLKNKGILLKA
ncbi:phenylalanine--tRNA ligase subunit beta [Filifactor villosus]|uniref:Phenylalanine--tRNA ligase beta subunit n=1 Tax=Filifactor villosus TaxID=29374 RepID=A0ABV9QLK9_9FIRM